MKNTQTIIALAFVFILLAGCTGAPKTTPQNSTMPLTLPLSVSCPNSTTYVDAPFSSAISASGGSGLYGFRISGTLPYGLSSNGQIIQGRLAVGTAGDYQYTATVQDSFNQTASATCSLKVIERIYNCMINGQVQLQSYTKEGCAARCASPTYCELADTTVKKSGSAWDNLRNIGVVVGVLVVAFLFLWKDVLYQWIKPENFELQKLRVPVVYHDLTFNIRTNEWRNYLTGEWGCTFEHSKRKGDAVPVSNYTHALGLKSNDKFQPFCELLDLPGDYRKALDDLKMVNAENASLREQHGRYLSTDIMGIAEGLSFKFKVVGENVHSVNVQPMNRSGQNYSGSSGAPPYQE